MPRRVPAGNLYHVYDVGFVAIEFPVNWTEAPGQTESCEAVIVAVIDVVVTTLTVSVQEQAPAIPVCVTTAV